MKELRYMEMIELSRKQSCKKDQKYMIIIGFS